jgi:hypothetical protein
MDERLSREKLSRVTTSVLRVLLENKVLFLLLEV